MQYASKINGRFLSLSAKLPIVIGLHNFLRISTRKKVYSYNHHLCHAYSSYLTRPLEWEDNPAIVATIDGQGDNYSSGIYLSNGSRLEPVSLIGNQFSICLLYAKLTKYCGFTPNADEGKLEAWACYSNSKRETNPLYKFFSSRILVNNLSVVLSPSSENNKLKSIKDLYPEIDKICNQMEKVDIAFAMQSFFEDIYLDLILNAVDKFDIGYLCLAGGGAANVKLNRRLFEHKKVAAIHVFPAMGDDGVSFGSACAFLAQHESNSSIEFLRSNSPTYWGYSVENVDLDLDVTKRLQLHVVDFPSVSDLAQATAELVISSKYGAVCRNSSEFGPRALGNRSIIANPFDPDVRDMINLKFKKREWFQPFCPIILMEDADAILTSWYNNKHMTCAFSVYERFKNILPSVVHVDNTARAQILEQEDNPFIYEILLAIKKEYGYGVLLNTSFNLHGRAIVRTASDALKDFRDCDLDFLIIQNNLVTRN